MEQRIFVILGCLFGLTGVVAGAFGAHAMKGYLSDDMLNVFETGVRYQMYHALVLFVVAWAFKHFDAGFVQAAGWCFAAGIVIFSGSLYVLTWTGIKTFGAVTPVGGLLLMFGWLMLLISVFRPQQA